MFNMNSDIDNYEVFYYDDKNHTKPFRDDLYISQQTFYKSTVTLKAQDMLKMIMYIIR
jgi:hypothetical protein